jgi:hypothetical protein
VDIDGGPCTGHCGALRVVVQVKIVQLQRGLSVCTYRRRSWTEAELARILAAHRDGLSTYAIATRFGCTASTVQKRLAELRAREERLVTVL